MVVLIVELILDSYTGCDMIYENPVTSFGSVSLQCILEVVVCRKFIGSGSP